MRGGRGFVSAGASDARARAGAEEARAPDPQARARAQQFAARARTFYGSCPDILRFLLGKETQSQIHKWMWQSEWVHS